MSDSTKGYLSLFITSLLFGTFEVVSKQILSVEVETINFLRFVIGGLFLLPFAIPGWKRMWRSIKPLEYLYILGLSSLFVAVSMAFYQVGLTYVPASTAVFLFTFNSVFVAGFAHLFLKERIKGYEGIFIIISLAGLAFIVNPGGHPVTIHTFYPLIAAALFGLYTVLIQPYMRRYGRIAILTLVILMGSIVNMILLTIRGIPIFVIPAQEEWIPLLYLGIFASGLNYVTYYKTMEYISVNIASTAFFMKPIIATILAVIFLNEVLSFPFFIGAALILSGSAVLIYFREMEVRKLNL